MLVRVWEYDVDESQVEEFVGHCRADGDWARLFASSPGHLGTELFLSVDRPGCYLTVDRFSDRAAWDAFLAEHGDEYRRLDAACETLNLREREIVEADVA